MRLLVFTDVNGAATAPLTRATLALARERPGTEVCGIVTSQPKAFVLSRRARARGVTYSALVAATNRGWRSRTREDIDLARIERDHGVPVLVPPNGDPNDPAFLHRLAQLEPAVALSYFSLSIFQGPLLALFRDAVNYHDGSLPDYRGLRATAFSIYHGEPASGFSFHRMTETVDAGPVLAEGSVPVGEAATLDDVISHKAAEAAAALPSVFDSIAAGDPGRPQHGTGAYFSAADGHALTVIEDPGLVTADELQRRIRAFDSVRLRIRGTLYPVTSVRPGRSGASLSFRTSDGAVLVPDRIQRLPRDVYRAYRAIRPANASQASGNRSRPWGRLSS